MADASDRPPWSGKTKARMQIRLARPAEKTDLEGLQRRASLANPGDREAVLSHADAIDLPAEQIEAGWTWVADRDGEILGFAVAMPRADGDFELDGLFVEPAQWRRGIGKGLVDHCVRVSKSAGAAALHVVGNPHARDFYGGCGFTFVETVATRFGEGLSYRRLL
jgi:GNAT superfamily N-acetyltransferase